MSKWGTSNGSRGGMPKSGMPENSQSGKTKKQVVKPPVGIWVLRSSRMAAMYSSTAGSLRAIPCPRVERESKVNTILRCLQLTWHVHAWHVLSWHEAIWSMSHKIKLIPHFHPLPRKCVRSQSMKDRKRKDNIFSSAQLLYLCIWILSVIVAQYTNLFLSCSMKVTVDKTQFKLRLRNLLNHLSLSKSNLSLLCWTVLAEIPQGWGCWSGLW